MKKLRLQVEEIDVEQFQVQPAATALRGTVQGLEDGCSDPFLCPDMPITYSCETNCSEVEQN
jgi:hypothetical protein